MPVSMRSNASLLFVLLVLSGCSQEKAPVRKKTFPLSGKITVNGTEPGSAIEVLCNPASPPTNSDPGQASVSSAQTEPDGSFKFSTYVVGDGVPAGDYTLTMSWRAFNVMSGSSTGPDKLKGRYSDPVKSEFKVTIKDQPVDLGVLKLVADDTGDATKGSPTQNIQLGAGFEEQSKGRGRRSKDH